MAAMHALVARVPTISSTSRGPIVNLVGWITMVSMILAVFTVLISKIIVLRRLIMSDLIITFAMLFSIGYTIAISSQVSHGLGSPLHGIAHSDYIDFQKSGYASQLLYLCALTSAKFSTLSLLVILTPQKSHRMPIYIVGGLVGGWFISSLIAAAFQCSLPNAYLITSGKCFHQTAFWDAVGVVDILTDFALMALPVMVVSGLQLPFKKKVAVSFAFSFRILAIGSCVFRLVELPKKSFRHGTNVTLDSWLFTVATELEVFFSIFATCVPHLRPFMESIQSGYLGGAIHEDEGRTGYGGASEPGNSYVMRRKLGRKTPGGPIGLETKNSVMSYVGTLRNKRDNESMELPRHGQRPVEKDGVKPTYIGQAVSTNDGRTTVKNKEGETGERERSESAASEGRGSHESVGSKAMIIKTTKEWSVSYQE